MADDLNGPDLEDEDDEELDHDDELDDDEDDDEGGPDPDLAAKVDKLEKALAKANKDAERQRRRRRDAEGSDVTELRERAERTTKKAAVRAALLDAGVSAKNAKLLVPLVNLDALELGGPDDDEVSGHETEVAGILKEYPHLVETGADEDEEPKETRRRNRRRETARVQSGGKGSGGDEPKTSAERLAAQIHGQ